jgi:hypothetical protein
MLPFDIKAASNELNSIQNEMDRMNKIVKELKKRKLFIMDKMQEYLNKNSHQGVLVNNMSIMNITKTKNKALPKKEKEEQMKRVISQVAGDQTNKILTDLNNATKGTPILEQKLVIKKQ